MNDKKIVPEDTELPSSSNCCLACSKENRSIVFIPCGHLITCVSCGHSLKSCPICRSDIKALFKVFQ